MAVLPLASAAGPIARSGKSPLDAIREALNQALDSQLPGGRLTTADKLIPQALIGQRPDNLVSECLW